jgi:type III pantothenate kinase
MSASTQPGLLAIDVGTSRVKVGWFPDPMACDSEKPSQLPIAAPQLPEPTEMFAVQHRGVPEDEFRKQFAAVLEPFDELWTRVGLASVDADALAIVFSLLKNCQRIAVPQMFEVLGLPIKLAIRQPHRVGIDRVLAAVAVNRIRSADRPAIVISLGSACTVNLISADGTFQGGAILPGLAMSANSLHTGTAALPLIAVENLEIPDDGIGKHTTAAMSAGIYWGLVGAIEKLIHEQSRSLDVEPQLFLTGGDAPRVIDALQASGHSVRLIPHLVLAGIAIACEARP